MSRGREELGGGGRVYWGGNCEAGGSGGVKDLEELREEIMGRCLGWRL